MSQFQYETSAATARMLPNEGWATKDFEVLQPMNSEMDVPNYPREVTPDFVVDQSGFVSPLADVLLITATRVAIQEATREYVRRIGPELPDDVREGFVQCAGMFDFAAPPDLDDQLG